MANKRRWEWFHKLGSPKWFFDFSSRWLPALAVISITLLAVGVFWGLAIAPEDAKQGNSYRIIFIHVPSAFLSLAGYYLMAIAGAVGLIWKMKVSYLAMRAAAQLGAMLTFIALFTGAVWGKPTWGTYWVWDARITSMLILFFLYLGVIALYGAYERKDTANKAAAILALVGTVNIPIIYKSVDWWYSLHQPATIKLTEAPSMAAEMWYPLLTMIIAFYVLYAVLLMFKMRSYILYDERKTNWVQSLVNSEK